jgi:hypothetical protein
VGKIAFVTGPICWLGSRGGRTEIDCDDGDLQQC